MPKGDLNISGKLIFYNISFNVIGKIIPLIIALFSIPFIVRSLGVEQFGILSLIWVSLSNYFGFFDFGLGQSTIKFIAEALGKKKKNNLPELVWTLLTFSILLGVVGTIVIIFINPFLVNNVFKISTGLRGTALKSFSIAALAVPIVTTISVSRGILEGMQRYDFLNFVKTPLSSLFFLIPVISIFFDFKLPEIILFLVVLQLLGAIAYLFFCFKTFPFIKKHFLVRIKRFWQLFNFGKWIFLSKLTFTFLTHVDRFLIGAIISVAAVGFYTAPLDPIARILILSESFIVLFPFFSYLGTSRKEEVSFYYTRAIKHLLVIMGVVAITIILFSGDILLFWLGEEFKEKSTTVLQFLVFGIFAISLTLVGENLIKGYGRPDIIAKLRLAEVPFYLLFLWFFINRFGIVGAAAVWMIRATIDAVLIILVSFKLSSINISKLDKTGTGRVLLFLLILGLMMIMGRILLDGLIFLFFVVFLIIIFSVIWRYVILDEIDIRFLKSILMRNK